MQKRRKKLRKIQEKESRLTVIAAGSLIDEQIIDTFTELENTQLFMNIMAVNFENVKKCLNRSQKP